MAGKNGQAADTEAVLDFGRVSWKDQKNLTLLGQRLQRAGLRLGDFTLDDDEYDAAEEKLQELTRRMEEFVCRIIVSIPDEWAVDDAPDDLDWSDPDSLNYLRHGKFDRLTQMLIASAEEVSGN